MGEEWRPVVGHVGKYEVSNSGIVRSLARLDSLGRRVSAKILASHLNQKGYARVVLSRGGRGKGLLKLVHYIVADAFLGGVPQGHHVRHRDGNRANNAVDNLFFGLPLAGEDNGFAKLSETSVVEIRELKEAGMFGGKYGATKVIAEQFGISSSHLRRVAKKQRR